MAHEHDWRLKAKTFAEPNPELAAQLEPQMKNPPIFYNPVYLKRSSFDGYQPNYCIPIPGLPEGVPITEVFHVDRPTEAYERAKHGVSTFVWACPCGETRKEECVGREPSNNQ